MPHLHCVWSIKKEFQEDLIHSQQESSIPNLPSLSLFLSACSSKLISVLCILNFATMQDRMKISQPAMTFWVLSSFGFFIWSSEILCWIVSKVCYLRSTNMKPMLQRHQNFKSAKLVELFSFYFKLLILQIVPWEDMTYLTARQAPWSSLVRDQGLTLYHILTSSKLGQAFSIQHLFTMGFKLCFGNQQVTSEVCQYIIRFMVALQNNLLCVA